MTLYLVSMCPTVNFIDSGELATDTYTLGICHPTGYPLFTLIGWIFSHLPLGFRVVYKLNIMAAFFCSLGLFVFFRFLVFLLNGFIFKDRKQRSASEESITSLELVQVFIPAVFGSLIFGFSETYWSQALAIEVYSLHVFFLSTVLYFFTKAIHIQFYSDNDAHADRHPLWYWYGFAFALGLAFTNHMTTILLAPACLFFYFYHYRFHRSGWIRILQMALPFLLGLSLYLYLPLRAAEHPLMNWGNPVNFDRFWTHFTGKVYRVWLFSSTEAAGKQFKYFIDTLPSEFAYFPYIFTVIGTWNLFKARKPLFMFTVILFAGCVLYSINYDIHDIDSYFLLAYLTIAIWSALGVAYFLTGLKNPSTSRLVGVLLVCSSALLIVAHYTDVNENKTLVVEDYTKDMFKSIESNGIVISYQWDYFVSAAYYFQLVENVRPDIVVIDKELMRRSWYYNQLERRYPWLIAQSRKEIDALLAELYKFEHDLPYNGNVIERHYTAVLRSFIEKNYGTRPVYVTAELEPQYTSGFTRVPSGLAFRLFTDNGFHDIAFPEYFYHRPSKDNKYLHAIFSLYAQSYVSKAAYLYASGKKENILTYINKALEIQPDFEQALLLKDKLGGG